MSAVIKGVKKCLHFDRVYHVKKYINLLEMTKTLGKSLEKNAMLTYIKNI